MKADEPECDCDGSSPRVRGKPRLRRVTLQELRIIPASAGQTCLRRCRSVVRPDHPRECGANGSVVVHAPPGAGSSPRVRGKHLHTARGDRLGRIIPASAGQTSPAGAIGMRWSDHPRECGANQSSNTAGLSVTGSSPRVRGKHRSRPKRQYHERIIPASAGQTASSMCRIRTRPDHPRECGANKTSTCYAARSVGSSPRVRGKRSWAVRSWASRRIIPASAGQTRKYMHERSAWPGSSPRVRGKLHALACVQALVRIIPASAGQTGHANGPARSKTDHPRECGANAAKKADCLRLIGSSPRVRGKPSFRG